jgi:hypothetical protein
MGRESSASIPLPYVPEEGNGFISLFVDFSIREDRFDLRFGMENGQTPPPEPVSIALSNPLSGEGSFQLGASLVKTEPKEEKAASLLPEEQKVSPVTAVFDEAALSRLEEAVLPGEPEPEPLVFPPEEAGEEIPAEESVPVAVPVQEPVVQPEPVVPAQEPVVQQEPVIQQESAAPAGAEEELAFPAEEEEPAGEPADPEEAAVLPSEEEPAPEFSPPEEGLSSLPEPLPEEEALPEPQDVS